MKLELPQDVSGIAPDKDLNRRDFIWTALGASAALAMARTASAQLITTDSSGIEASDVSILVASGQLRGYRAMPLTATPMPTIRGPARWARRWIWSRCAATAPR